MAEVTVRHILQFREDGSTEWKDWGMEFIYEPDPELKSRLDEWLSRNARTGKFRMLSYNRAIIDVKEI